MSDSANVPAERTSKTRIDDRDPLGAERRRSARVRIAAVGDFHCGEEDAGAYRDLFGQANEDADLLLLAGDLTRRGRESEYRVVVGELADVEIPICAVLGNHDYECGLVAEGSAVLRGRGIHLLAGDIYQFNDKVSVAGVKGFIGGYGRGTLTAFGEPEIKALVQASMDEVQLLEMALRRLATPYRVVLMHYAPVIGTVDGEPDVIYPFLGTDRLAEPLDRFAAAVAFHGHAHSGAFRGETSGGVPVFNVSLSVLRRDGVGQMYYVHELRTPEPGITMATPPSSPASSVP
ncbi:MAG: metallophosphoesterase family protein [Gemmatimonadaceae bacterium]